MAPHWKQLVLNQFWYTVSLFSLKVSPMLGQNCSCTWGVGCLPGFFPATKETPGPSASLKNKGYRAEYFKMAGTSPHRPTALPWLPRSISNAETEIRDWGKQLKKPKHLYIQFKPKPSLSYKAEESKHSGINWSTYEGKNKEPEVRFYERDHGYQMKSVCFCKNYPVSFIMTVLLLVHPRRAELISSLWHTADI